MNDNGTPKWASELSADVKEMFRQSIADAKKRDEQAEKDRKQAEEDRKQAAEDRKQFMMVVETAIGSAAKQFVQVYQQSRAEAARDRKEILRVGIEIIHRLDKLIWHFNGHGKGNGHRGNGDGKRR